MTKFTPKVPLAQFLPVLSDIFLAVLTVLSGVFSLAPALARFGPQWFAKHAGFNLAFLTWRCSGSATPPTELQR